MKSIFWIDSKWNLYWVVIVIFGRDVLKFSKNKGKNFRFYSKFAVFLVVSMFAYKDAIIENMLLRGQ